MLTLSRGGEPMTTNIDTAAGFDVQADVVRMEPHDINSGLMSPLRPHVIVLFGATGDLASRKLLPGLLHLSLIPEYRIVGTSLDELDDEGFRDLARRSCEKFCRQEVSDQEWAEFAGRLSFASQSAGPDGLARAVAAAEAELGGACRLLHYLSSSGLGPGGGASAG